MRRQRSAIAWHRMWARACAECAEPRVLNACAQAFRAVDGAADGFDSEEEVYESAEDKCALLRAHACKACSLR